ncbi:MAG TPA: HAD family hydrolase, partial [Symbiobacteriaceae bacterium]|nr:HAD family hydrolase [Symbiobacteriaceae bacterium]
MTRWGVFLDRDGTVNADPGYLHDPDQLRLLPGAAEAIARLNRRGVPVILVTNQAGIARGLYTETDFWRVQERLSGELGKAGARLDAVYFCPHHPDGTVLPYRVVCQCRKPRPGMLLRAAAEHGLDLSTSFMIGDRPSDVQAGASAGCRTVLVGMPPAREGG